MVYLSKEDDTRDLYLFINSPNRWVIPGIAIYDTMQFVPPDVHKICMGLAASMGSFILVGGEMTKRLAQNVELNRTSFFFSIESIITTIYIPRNCAPQIGANEQTCDPIERHHNSLWKKNHLLRRK
ncbi:hypothetical protein NE237_009497 [Protea cynaroides]|uniref:ATP-dependent Clp protease proteolytic subunit n=1 Tax=Protea cynaroides TaxID=273540 RepID=A0A9Q0R0P4_9MAGN|nr:hypothetical protein NE237_009497 [Protea cynaroides]